MPFDIGGFNPPSKKSFSGKSFGNFEDLNQFKTKEDYKKDVDRFRFQPINAETKSRIRFYDYDSLWTRWRRGYELYAITQSVLGSFASERRRRGDFRLYFAFQQFPGVFTPARIFTFPTTNNDVGSQFVGMRDANGFNFFNVGLPILGVRFLGPSVATTYSQSGTTLTVNKSDHGLFVGENVFLDVQTGAGVDDTLTITATTQNTFTVTAAAPLTTSGNLIYYLSTVFTDTRWTTTRVRLRFIPTPVNSFAGERLIDRIVEKDPGISSTYTRTATTVTITCGAAHGLSTGNKIFIDVSTGSVASGQYDVTVINPTQLTITTIASGATSGNLILSRLIQGFRYDDYVGFTVTGVDVATNEIIFQRDDSYGSKEVNSKFVTTVPAERGFAVGRFLTTELRWQCSCQDFMRRESFNFSKNTTKQKFPVTAITSTKPGQVQNSDNIVSDRRDTPGTYSDLGYSVTNNFYGLPSYEDKSDSSYPNLFYYQTRWCKHIYAAMFSIVHDEGNEPIAIAATYSQAGPNITITAPNHGLAVNSKVQLDFTSGDALSGQYTVTNVPDRNTFVIIYPFSEITSGYVTISNLKEHDFCSSWILEPSDKPVGDSLDKFYRNFEKENEKLKDAAERLMLKRPYTPWVGDISTIGSNNLPEQVANYTPEVISMLLTDNIRRGTQGELDRSGVETNTANSMLTMMSKLFNLTPTLIQDVKFGLLNEPLINFTNSFEFGLIDGGTYLNGEMVEPTAQMSLIDCETYFPLTAQDTFVDGGLYINT